MHLINNIRILDKRILIVLKIGLILWLYAAVLDFIVVYVSQLYGTPADVTYADSGARLLHHILLLPLLLGSYFLATLFYDMHLRTPLMWAIQIGLCMLYGLMVRPLSYLSIMLVHHGRFGYFYTPDAPSAWALQGVNMFFLLTVLSNYTALYLVGLFLMFTMFRGTDLAEERLRLERLSTEWLTIKLRTLQWQINPHFLFNSLNTVSALLKTSPSRADQVLAMFSELLRTTLWEQENFYTSVNDELNYVHRYLDLEKTRFEDRLKLQIEADEDALDAELPSLLLQPLIENAIKHGIAKIPGTGYIKVNVTRDRGNLIMEVSNGSSGPSQPAREVNGTGLGIKNLRERLLTIYQDSFRFSSSQDKNKWISVIEIPYKPRLPQNHP